MKKKFENFCVATDVFRYPITVFFLSKNTISTQISIVSSWLFCAILLVNFSQSDMWHKLNPKITDQMVDSGGTSLQLNKENFDLNVWFWDTNHYYNYLDPSYGNIVVRMMKYNSSMDVFLGDIIPLVNCTDNESLGAYCIDQEIYLNVTEASWSGDFSFLGIQLNYCSNQTSPIPCQDFEVMQAFFRGKYFSYSMKEYLFNFRNYETPAKINLANSKNVMINPNIYQFHSYSLMEVLLFQDSNPIFGNGEDLYRNYFQIDSSQFYSEIYLRDFEKDQEATLLFDNVTVVEFEILPNRYKREVIRNYVTLIDTLSNLGGLASFLKILGILISSFSANAKILRQLHQNIYAEASYPSPENLEAENEHPNIKLEENMLGNSIEMSYRNKNDIEADQTLGQIKESPNFMKSSTRRFQTGKIKKEITKSLDFKAKNITKIMTIWEFILFKLHLFLRRELTPKDKVIAEIEKSYIRDFDILNLLRRVKNLELLKSVVLHEQEKKLYEIIEGKQFSLGENPPIQQIEIERTLRYYEERQSEFKLSERELRLWEIYLTKKK